MSDEKPDLAVILEHYDIQVTHGKQVQMTKCPFHETVGKHFSINTGNGLYNCKSCGERGDSYTLIMKKEGVDFVGARAFAAGLGLSDGGTGGGDERVSGSRHAGGRAVAARKGAGSGGSSYVPRWRRS